MTAFEPGFVVAVSGIGLAVGAGLGVGGLVWPGWAGRLVGLSAERADGAAEFRATYGGMFLFGHAAVLWLLVRAITEPATSPWAMLAAGGALALGAAWIGTALGRAISMAQDAGTKTPFNTASTVFEAILGVAIAALWLAIL